MGNKMDERDLGAIANSRPREIPRKYKMLGTVGLLVMVAGALLYLGKGLFSGIAIAAVGLIIEGVSTIFQSKVQKKAKLDFIDYYKKNGELLPYPEKQNEKKI